MQRFASAFFPDDPFSVEESECRYQAAIVAPDDAGPDGEVEILILNGGTFAVFAHNGSYETLPWGGIFSQWLPTSGAVLRNAPPFERYLNNPSDTPPEELRTEILIPIE